MIFRPSSLILCFILALAAPVPAVQAGPREDARAALARGNAALARGDARTARVELMNAIKADPRLAAARIAQARALLMLGDGNAAWEELERAQALGAAPGLLRPLRAHAALLQGRPADALVEARSPDADPREALLLARLEGQSLQAMGEYDQAAKAFARALAMSPDAPGPWTDMARLHIAAGDVAAALSATDRALQLAPGDADALTLRGLMARDQYGLAAAALWFGKALKADPAYVPALMEQAATLADLGRASQAVALTRRALALSPGLPRAWFIQAVMAARAEKYDLARSLLARTGGALDGQAATRMLRGVLHIQAGNATLAAGELAPLLEAQPLNLRARLLLARALYDGRQYAEAERALFPIVERADAGSYALTLAARIHEALGDRDAAAGLLGRAAALSPGPPAVYRGAGKTGESIRAADADPAAAAPNLRYIRALLEAGQTGPALSRAARLAAANPGAPPAFVVLGDCLMTAGRYKDAAVAYEHAANMRFGEDVALRLIDAWQRAGDRGKAQRVLGLLLAQNPMNIEGQRLAASYLLATGHHARALAILSGLRARLGNHDALLMADIARAHVGLGDAKAALPFAAHAYRLQPASGVTSDILGWALFRAGGSDPRSLELLRKAEMLAPAEPLVKLHLGQVYAAFGEREKARAALRIAAGASGFARRAEAQAALRAL